MKKTAMVILFILTATLLFSRPYLYVAHNKYKKISVIDTAVNEVIRDVKLGVTAKDLKLDPKNKYLYFCSFDYNSLHRLKTKNLAVDDDYVSVGYGPVALDITPDGKKAYVANYKSKNVSVVDLASMEIIADPITVPGAPKAIIVTDDNKKVLEIFVYDC